MASGSGDRTLHEVQRRAIDGRQVLRQLVELCLVLTPVVRRAPVLGQLAQVVQRDSETPALAWELLGPPGPGQSVAEVLDCESAISIRNV